LNKKVFTLIELIIVIVIIYILAVSSGLMFTKWIENTIKVQYIHIGIDRIDDELYIVVQVIVCYFFYPSLRYFLFKFISDN